MGHAESTPNAGMSGQPLAGLPAFEPPWRRLERAAREGNPLAYAAASASAGRICLTDGDLDEALWHVRRGWLFLDLPVSCEHSLALRCELAALTLALSNQSMADDAQARRLRDDTRDAVFDILRRCNAVQGRHATLLQVADILDALGDRSDADTVRRQVPQN